MNGVSSGHMSCLRAVLQQMFSGHDVCIAWAHLRHTNCQLAVHLGLKSAVPNHNLYDLKFADFVKAV